jgi:hypothetical protein
MRDYFTRLAAVNFVVTVLCLTAAYFVEIDNWMLLGGLLGLFCLRFMLGKTKAERMRVWNLRRKVFRNEKRLKWISILVNFVAPVWVGAAAYSVFSYSPNNALIWFMGATHLGALIMNWVMLPRVERVIGEAFV